MMMTDKGTLDTSGIFHGSLTAVVSTFRRFTDILFDQNLSSLSFYFS